MFYPVRIFNRKGKLKKEVAPKSLSKKYWDQFNNSSNKNIQISTRKVRQMVDYDPQAERDENLFSED